MPLDDTGARTLTVRFYTTTLADLEQRLELLLEPLAADHDYQIRTVELAQEKLAGAPSGFNVTVTARTTGPLVL